MRFLRFLIVFVVALATLYFGGGLIAVAAINGATIDVRGHDETYIQTAQKMAFFYSRDHFPKLAKRETPTFESDGAKIQGYYYSVPSPKGVVVYVHGLSGCADDNNAAPQAYFVRQGYDVFSFDGYACGRSEGSGQKNLAHFSVTLKDALSFLDTYSFAKGKPYFLCGHSAGAYACAINAKHPGVKAAALLTGFNTLDDEMYDRALLQVGDWLSITKPAFDLSTTILFGDNGKVSAAKAVEETTDVRFLITKAAFDKVVPPHSSISDAVKYTLPHVTKVVTNNGHEDAWQSKEGYAYYQEIVAKAFHPKQHTREECDAYAKTVSLDLINQIDETLFGQIVTMFEEATEA